MRPTCFATVLTLTAAGLAVGGCQSSHDIVDEGLAGPHPATASVSTLSAYEAPPPVEPGALAIAPTLLGPTETTDVEPDPILPKMDSFFKDRKLPPGYEQYASPTTRASEHPDPPAAPEVNE